MIFFLPFASVACTHPSTNVGCALLASFVAYTHRFSDFCQRHAPLTKAYMHIMWHGHTLQATSSNGIQWRREMACTSTKACMHGCGTISSSMQWRPIDRNINQDLHVSTMSSEHQLGNISRGLSALDRWHWLTRIGQAVFFNDIQQHLRYVWISCGVCTSPGRHRLWLAY